MDDLVYRPPKSNLKNYLSVPEVRDTFVALRNLCIEEEFVCLEQQVALTCAEAVRYAYKMSKELGIDRVTFLDGLDKIIEVEDREYRLKHYN